MLGFPKHGGKDEENLTHFFRHYHFLILIRKNNLVVRPKKLLLVPRNSYFSQKVVVRHNYLHGIFPLHNFVAGNRTDTAVSPSIQIY